ncbi:hypothetical protein K1T71_011671 [Dendrolimus kikuchii]|uniref:Uncharacterized protein n=1 Tax=Dendrolimus kikuchii TaxID=765133 RepID=A0ACC1CLT7_9NEOP|nr:hypothetical protein K1T71_011671 [Dendrolimus kikuchii]
MPQCVHRCRRARRSELWPPRYWLLYLFHSHIAQLVAVTCRAPLAAPQVAPQCASPVFWLNDYETLKGHLKINYRYTEISFRR